MKLRGDASGAETKIAEARLALRHLNFSDDYAAAGAGAPSPGNFGGSGFVTSGKGVAA